MIRTQQSRADLGAFVKRGGGIVSIHDSLCGPDPAYFANTFTRGRQETR